jgi:hypothetical protein
MRDHLQYTSPNTSTLLKRAGLSFRSDFYWRRLNNRWALVPRSQSGIFGVQFYPAYSISDLGLMIPWGFFQQAIVHKMPGGIWQVKLSDDRMHSFATEVEARAWYLLDLIKIKKVTVQEIIDSFQPNKPARKETDA